MAKTVLISITGADRVGVIAAITAQLFELGADLGDTNFAVLGTSFEFSSVCELPDSLGNRRAETELRALEPLADAEVRVSNFKYQPQHEHSGRVSHRIQVSGGDQPGVLARLTEVFGQFGANIVSMNSQRQIIRGHADYATRFAVSIPKDRADSCLAAIGNTAGQLQMIFTWEEAGTR